MNICTFTHQLLSPKRSIFLSKLAFIFSLSIRCTFILIALLHCFGFATLDGDQSRWTRSPLYRISGSLPNLDQTQAYNAIRQSFETWNEVSGSTFQAVEASNPSQEVEIEIGLIDEWPAEFGENAAGVTLTIRNRGVISQAQIYLNGQNFEWEIANSSESSLTRQESDVQGVTTHEIGHALGLTHSFYRAATMYYSGGDYQLRSLDEDDLRGLRYLYGGLQAGQMCDTCIQNSDCTSQVCIQYENRQGYCGSSCELGCPENAGCAELNNGLTTCVPLTLTCDDEAIGVAQAGDYCFGAQHCVDSAICVPEEDDARCTSLGSGQYGEACLASPFCESNLCVPVTEAQAICTEECSPNQSNPCPLGGTCIPVNQEGFDGICLPPGNQQEGEQCDGRGLRCENGFECIQEGRQRVCTIPCEPYGECPQGRACTPYLGRWSCQSTTEGQQEGEFCSGEQRCAGGLYCFASTQQCVRPCDPNVASSCDGEVCFSLTGLGICSPGEGRLGDPCEDELDCVSFQCVSFDNQMQCTRECTDDPCPDGWICEGRSPSRCIPEPPEPEDLGMIEPIVDQGVPSSETGGDPMRVENQDLNDQMLSQNDSGCQSITASSSLQLLIAFLFLLGFSSRRRVQVYIKE